MNKCFYVGSCRYQNIFPHFPPKLQSTKEILYFLKNFDKLDINTKNLKNINIIYGDSIKSIFIEDFDIFNSNKEEYINKYTDTFIIEITTIKYYEGEDGVIYNVLYTDKYCKDSKDSKIVYKTVSGIELENDILRIKNIIKEKFNISRLIIICHLNLKLKNTNEYINDRNKLVETLEIICNKLNIEIVDFGKIFQNEKSQTLYLEDITTDTLHITPVYNVKIYTYFKEYLNDDITPYYKWTGSSKNNIKAFIPNLL